MDLSVKFDLYGQALVALPDGVLIMDGAHRVVFSNPAFAKMWNLQLKPGDSLDETSRRCAIDQLVDPASFEDAITRLNASEESCQDEMVFRDGRVFSWRSVYLPVAGRAPGRIWIFTDITEARFAALDALTGVRSRRAFNKDIPVFAARQSGELKFSLAVLDLDNFKKFNDRYGHATGDRLLLRLGEVLREQFPHTDDRVYRIGGEEFALAVDARTAESGIELFLRLRHSIEALRVPHPDNAPHGHVTASIGVARFTRPQNAEFLYRVADTALYRAKADGRNRVVMIEL